MRQLQVIPTRGFNLYGALIAKEVELGKKNKGTFFRNGAKEKGRAKWAHSTYPGWVNLARSMGEVVTIEIRTKKADQEWQLLNAFLGFLNRHFSEHIQAINIQLQSEEVDKPKVKRAASGR